MILGGYKRLMAGLGPHLVDFLFLVGAVHLTPPPLPPALLGGDPQHSFSRFGSLWGREREGETEIALTRRRTPMGSADSFIIID